MPQSHPKILRLFPCLVTISKWGTCHFFQSTVTASSRLKLCLVVGVCALASAPGLAGAKSLDPEQPNLLLILVDDMGWPSLSVQMDPDNPDSRSDYHQTPNLETLAQQGMVFSNGYAAGPMCSPSRVAVQTGATPAGLRVTDLRQAANNSHGWYSAWYNGRPLTPPQPRNLFWESNIAGVLEQIDPSYNTGWFGKWDWWPQPTDTGYDSANDNDPRVNSPPEDPKGIFSLTQLATNFLDDNDQNDDPFFSAYFARRSQGKRGSETSNPRRVRGASGGSKASRTRLCSDAQGLGRGHRHGAEPA